MDIIEELKKESKRFNKIAIWGLRRRFNTFRYIYSGFYRVLKKVGVPVIWVEDEMKNQKFIKKNDLIISADVVGKMVPEKLKFEDYNLPVRDDVYYCLHNFKEIFTGKINPEKLLKLQGYNNKAENYEKIYKGVHFDKKNKILYQPWGTNLFPEEFKEPVFNKNKFIFWVGSVWNDKNGHGNINEINELKTILKKNNLKFINVRFVPDWLNTFLIRNSRIAPAIGGNHQVEVNCLPCRMFKNISYGQLGFSNVKKFNDIFKDCNIYDENMEKMIDKVLSLNKNEYIGLVKKQQEICKNYTYLQHLNNILKAFKQNLYFFKPF